MFPGAKIFKKTFLNFFFLQSKKWQCDEDELDEPLDDPPSVSDELECEEPHEFPPFEDDKSKRC